MGKKYQKLCHNPISISPGKGREALWQKALWQKVQILRLKYGTD